jgi:hypothetical protein
VRAPVESQVAASGKTEQLSQLAVLAGNGAVSVLGDDLQKSRKVLTVGIGVGRARRDALSVVEEEAALAVDENEPEVSFQPRRRVATSSR